jgi:DNA-directed RNA polymerase subunit alpha
MRPQEALAQAGQILIRHLTVISGIDVDVLVGIMDEGDGKADDSAPANGKRPDLYVRPIEELDLSVRVFNSLKRTGITTVGDVLDMLERGQDAMLAIRNFGEKSLDELVEKLQEKGYLPSEQDEEEPAE